MIIQMDLSPFSLFFYSPPATVYLCDEQLHTSGWYFVKVSGLIFAYMFGGTGVRGGLD